MPTYLITGRDDLASRDSWKNTVEWAPHTLNQVWESIHT